MTSEIRFHQLMHIYLRNNPAKFHPNPIGNDGALGFFEERRPKKTTTTTTTTTR